MYTDFAYSQGMQIILAVQSYMTNTLIMYLIANLILMLADVKASAKQKLVFAFWVGAVFYQSLIYAVYVLGGMASFSSPVYELVVSPNPILGYLYYIVGVRVLKLSPIRSIKLMGYFFMYFIFVSNITRLVTALWPIETMPRYNYLQNAERQVVYLILVFIIYFLTQYAIKKTNFIIRLADKVFIDLRTERIIYMAKLLFLHTLSTFLPRLIRNNILGSAIVILVLVFFIAFNIVLDLLASSKMEAGSKEVHINVLSKAVTEFSELKHDFNNILQTYNGYLEIGDLDSLREYHAKVVELTIYAGKSIDFSHRMEENPAFISLLANKIEYAERVGVKMTVTLQCSAEDLYMENLDICRSVVCLLDNAIEAAALSEQKTVFFTLESKKDNIKLIIITNSTAGHVDISKIGITGVTSKHGNHGYGLASVRKILAKYGNCAFNMTYFDNELSAYVELRKI